MKYQLGRFPALAALITLLVVGAASGAQIVHYNCNEGAGTTLADNSGNGHTAYLYNGVSWVNDPWGGSALAFGGNDVQQYAMVSGAELEGIDDIEAEGALEFWYYTPTGVPYGHYMGFNAGGANWTDERLFVFSSNPPTYRDLAVMSDGSSNTYLWGLNNSATRDSWTHMVFTWRPSGGGTYAYLYTNGALRQSGSLAGVPEISNIPFWIGRSYGVGNQYYTGYLDEISIWDNLMTSGEVQSRFSAAVGGMASSIAGHVDLQGVDAGFNPAMAGIEVQLRPPGQLTPIDTVYTLLDAGGNYRISPVTPGTYDVAIKASCWLREVVPSVVVGDQGATATVSVSLANGDQDGDNEVTTTDLSTVLKNPVTPVEPALVPVVVTGDSPTASEQYAAEEMATYLGKILNKQIDIVSHSSVPGGRLRVAVGLSNLTSDISISGLDPEQYVIDVQPSNNLVRIRGGVRSAALGVPARDAATLYGVYDFLERLGVRWYRPEPWGEHVPRMNDIPLQAGTTTSPKPSYFMRAIMPGGMSYYREESPLQTRQAQVWQVRNRVNGGVTNDPAQIAQFGGMEKYSWEGGWSQFIPKSLFATHPEYFALIDGVRTDFDLSPGHPDVQDLYAANVIAAANADPYMTSFSMEPDDGRGGFCECSLCLAMDLPTNTRDGGKASNRVSKFANIVAQKVHQTKPYLKLQWLGYSTHTAAPTNIAQLEPNLIIMPAPINGWDDWRTTLTAPPYNSQFVTVLQQWDTLNPSTMMIYQYFNGYGWPGPIPITATVADRVRNYRGLGIEGLYNTSVYSWGPESMDIYMLAKLFWNPDLDLDQELDLYYTNYYGPAAAPMKLYHQALMSALATSPRIVLSGGRGMHLVFTPSLVTTLGNYMNQAEALVSGEPLYEQRLYGVWAGYEFSKRLSELLSLKKATGVLTPTGSGGYYYQSSQAEDAYGDLVRWMRTVSTGDPVFDMVINFKDDAAEKIYPGPGDSFGAAFLHYMPGDILKNAIFGHLSEQVLLADF